MGDDFYEQCPQAIDIEEGQFNLFISIINVAAVDWFLFASNPTGRCFSHSFDLLSLQHGTYILQMLHLHSEFASKYFKIFPQNFLKIFKNIFSPYNMARTSSRCCFAFTLGVCIKVFSSCLLWKKNIAENFVSILLFLYAYKRFEDWR